MFPLPSSMSMMPPARGKEVWSVLTMSLLQGAINSWATYFYTCEPPLSPGHMFSQTAVGLVTLSVSQESVSLCNGPRVCL